MARQGSAPQSGQLPPASVRRFTPEEYHRLGELGVLNEDDRVELLDGWIVQKMIHNPEHDLTIELVDGALRKRLPPDWRLRIQCAISMEESEPEPDVAVVYGDPRDRAGRHPLPGDVALLVEAADSLEYDRTFKGPLYAHGRIPVYWIVNLVDSQVEVYTEPSGPGPSPLYKVSHIYRRGDAVPLVIRGQTLGDIPLAEILP
jgi:Uma2 family endonuclease